MSTIQQNSIAYKGIKFFPSGSKYNDNAETGPDPGSKQYFEYDSFIYKDTPSQGSHGLSQLQFTLYNNQYPYIYHRSGVFYNSYHPDDSGNTTYKSCTEQIIFNWSGLYPPTAQPVEMSGNYGAYFTYMSSNSSENIVSSNARVYIFSSGGQSPSYVKAYLTQQPRSSLIIKGTYLLM